MVISCIKICAYQKPGLVLVLKFHYYPAGINHMDLNMSIHRSALLHKLQFLWVICEYAVPFLQIVVLFFFLQGVYNPYAGQHYLQIYGVPGAVNTGVYPYGQLGQTIPGGHGYTAMTSYPVPGHQVVQFGGPGVNTMTTSSMPTIQSPYPTGSF